MRGIYFKLGDTVKADVLYNNSIGFVYQKRLGGSLPIYSIRVNNSKRHFDCYDINLCFYKSLLLEKL